MFKGVSSFHEEVFSINHPVKYRFCQHRLSKKRREAWTWMFNSNSYWVESQNQERSRSQREISHERKDKNLWDLSRTDFRIVPCWWKYETICDGYYVIILLRIFVKQTLSVRIPRGYISIISTEIKILKRSQNADELSKGYMFTGALRTVRVSNVKNITCPGHNDWWLRDRKKSFRNFF